MCLFNFFTPSLYLRTRCLPSDVKIKRCDLSIQHLVCVSTPSRPTRTGEWKDEDDNQNSHTHTHTHTKKMTAFDLGLCLLLLFIRLFFFLSFSLPPKRKRCESIHKPRGNHVSHLSLIRWCPQGDFLIIK